MEVYLIVYNDGIDFRVEEIWFDGGEASKECAAKGEPYQVLEFKTKDLPKIPVNGFNAIKEIEISDYEIV